MNRVRPSIIEESVVAPCEQGRDHGAVAPCEQGRGGLRRQIDELDRVVPAEAA